MIYLEVMYCRKGRNMWEELKKRLDEVLRPIQNRNIIIYGANGVFLQWFCERFYNKPVKCIIDRWQNDCYAHILHLMSLYYIWDEKDVIINVKPAELGPKEEFLAIGEDWTKVLYKDEQIINLWDILYNDCEEKERDITFYDYIEHKMDVQLLSTIRRSKVKGEHAHGYYPTDYRLLYDIFMNSDSFSCEDAILDIGCGKGAGLIALWNFGFHNLGGIEYTDNVFDILVANIEKMGMPKHIVKVNSDETIPQGSIISNEVRCYHGDASQMAETLDLYNVFYFFNPFSYVLFAKVFKHIVESIERSPRMVKIVYAEPMCHSLILDSGYFQLEREMGMNYGGITYNANVYVRG